MENKQIKKVYRIYMYVWVILAFIAVVKSISMSLAGEDKVVEWLILAAVLFIIAMLWGE